MSGPRAMLLERPAPAAAGPLRAVTRAPEAPGPGQLLLRIAACGVCRTDLQLCEGDLAPRKMPIVPGHQIVGRIEAVGDGVSDWRAGDRAGVAWLAGTCGVCDKCRSERENLVPPIYRAVLAYATVGEITDRLRRVFGVYVPSRAF